ncbi:hypothetical protein [Pseudomonas sp. HY7a-MNA-CIBAN-0227]|uniref:hypothetical protein n=1 Tax=Pseudomonas sp. HY7a-MNA-CIBAN-0227 TaxID=3140474 RepID=UPI0033239599
MGKLTTKTYEEKVSKAINAEIEKIAGELYAFIKQSTDNQYIYIAEEIKPYLLHKVKDLDFPRFNSIPVKGYSIASCIYAYTLTENEEREILGPFDSSRNLISTENFIHYLQDSQGASTFGDYLKLLLTTYKMTLGKSLASYLCLIKEQNFIGDDNAEYSNDGSHPKREFLKRIAYIVLTSENKTEEEQVLSFTSDYELTKFHMYQPEYLCKLLGIECINVIRNGEYSYGIYFKSNKGLHHLKFNGDEYSIFTRQSSSRAWSEVKHHSKISFAGKTKEAAYVDDIEFSDSGFLMLEMLHFGNITKIYPAKTRTLTEKLKYHLTGRNLTRRYGRFLSIVSGFIAFHIMIIIIPAMI